MAIKQLSPEEVRSMTLEEKDRWWLANVYRGDMPQLTWRSGITGMLLGAVLSLTNLYIGAKSGWALGIGLTSVILSFATFKLLTRLRVGREMTLLENNAMQSCATAAGYMNFPLFTSFAAYTMVTMQMVPMLHVYVWLMVLCVIGVLFAFPLKKRFINDEQLPFPEGKAAGVVMDALHESDAAQGIFQAKLLVASGAIAALIELIRDDLLMRVAFAVKSIPENWDDFLYGDGIVGAFLKGRGLVPRVLGVTLPELSVQWESSIILMATGGLTGMAAATSMLIGGVLNYFVIAPILIREHIILPVNGHYGFQAIVIWSLWGGVACMTVSSLYAFFSKPKVLIDAFRGLLRRRSTGADVLADIELPTRVSFIGLPLATIALVVLGKRWFGIEPWLGVIAVPMVFVYALISVQATGETSITPTGALAKLTQLTYGVLSPKNIVTNVLTAGITSEASSNTANLMMDIKPGYMLGAKPRQQAVAHLLGGLAGLSLSVPVWYYVFIHGDLSLYGSQKLPMPGAVQWKAVAEVLREGLSRLDGSARVAVVVGALVGLAVEVSKQVTKNRFPLSAIGLGLAFVLPFNNVWVMFLGALVYWLVDRRGKRWTAAHAAPEAAPKPAVQKKPWYVLGSENAEVICAGIIAGGALMGVFVQVMDVLVLKDFEDLRPLAPLVKKATEAIR
jgi:uncharacterized oligopeptide transporter (OPT) family protein